MQNRFARIFVAPLLIALTAWNGLAVPAASAATADPSGERAATIDRAPAQSSRATARPKLILLLVIDQFRADYLTRFESRFLPASSGGKVGGFRYLMERGAYYPFGEYDLLQAMTGPGHATIATGAYPYQMGIGLNKWYEPGKGMTYCAEDRSAKVIGYPDAKPDTGTSPRNLIGSTFGDELKLAGYPSRVVSIALKDRSAIFMGGHLADLALWFEPKVFRWVSSTHYLPEGKLPGWVDGLNSSLERRKGQPLEWKLTKGSESGHSLSGPAPIMSDDRNAKEIGKQFPHTAKAGSYASLAMPLGAEIPAEAAESAMKAMGLGRGKATDVLAVSFSNHDYLGHSFGPNSREMEEHTAVMDRVVSRVLNAAREQVPGGLENVVVVLTGDHGAPPTPEWLAAQGMNAGRFDEEKAVAELEKRLLAKFGKPKGETKKWIAYNTDYGFFLDHPSIEQSGKSHEEVENLVREFLRAQPEVAQVYTATDVRKRTLPGGVYERRILRTHYFGRSADVVAIPKPFYMTVGDTVDHITAHSYDRSVPIILAGPGIRAGKYAEKAEVVDIAPTLTFLSGTLPPAVSEGRVLSEALATRR